METTRYLKRINNLFIGGALLVLPFFVFGYSDTTTHPALTQEIIKFYNDHFPEKSLNGSEAELVIMGSIDEDKDTRWLYHFYDPVYNRGLILENKAFPENNELALMGSGAKSSWESSKEWGTKSDLQNGFWKNLTAGIFTEYFGDKNDYSWNRAIYEYAWRDKKRGLEALGHVLHLIEDVSVPDHVRNDPHPSVLNLGSPYESWTKKFNRNNFLLTIHERPIFFQNIGEHFDVLAKYSNNNFFSKNTILKKEYPNPKIANWKKIKLGNNLTYSFGYSENGINIVAKLESDWRATIENEYFIDDPDNIILTDYWNLLSKQAILHGAGVIKLFFDEVEKEKQTRALYSKNRSWFDKLTTSWLGKIWDNLWGANTNNHTTNTNLAAVIAQVNNPPQSVEVPLPAKNQLRSGKSEASKPSEANEPAQTVRSPTSNIPDTGSIMNPIVLEASIQTQTALLPSSNLSSNLPTSNGGGGDYTSPQNTQSAPPPITTPSSLPENISTSTETATSTEPAPIESATTNPPSIDLKIKECENSLSNEACLIATSTVTLEWVSDTPIFDRFEILCRLNEFPCPGFEFTNTAATSTIYILPEETSKYIFSAKAIDSFNQESSTIVKTLEYAVRPIIINEIAWAGTSSAKPQDEWIELFNPTDVPINLSGIKLKSLTDGKPEITLGGTLDPKSYYLIERTDDTTVSDIQADLITSFGGGVGSGLSNNGEILALEFNGTILDKTPDPEICRGWCAGIANPYFYSMERYEPLENGTDKNNWSNWNGVFATKHNSDEFLINGTPGERNSINYLIDVAGTYLTKNKTLKKSSSPYVILSNSITIPENLALKIEPGVTIKFFDGGSLDVAGKLESIGTEENPIIFTSIKDDSHAGDTNQDTNSTEPKTGDWTAIRISGTGTANISNAIIRFGGLYDPLGHARAALKAEGGNLSIKNSTIENSGAFGIWLKNASSSFSGNIIRNNTAFHNSDSTGMTVEGGSAEITNNTFENNHWGLMLIPSAEGGDQHDFRVIGNAFLDNESYAVFLNNSYPFFSGNSASGNGRNGIGIHGTLTNDHRILSPDLPYIIENNSYYVPENKTLSILPGTVLKFYGSGTLQIDGTLKTEGIAENKVVFTSLNDDEYGGDTNGTSTEPAPGDWLSLDFLAASKESVLDNAIIRYGGNKTIFYPARGALRIFTSSSTKNALLIKNSIIEKSFAAGIWMENASSTAITDSEIRDNREPNQESTSGLFLINSSVSIANTVFINNKIGVSANSNSSIQNGGGIIFEGNDTDTDPPGLLP